MTSSSMADYQDSTQSHQSHNRSHRKVPTRLPLELVLNNHNDHRYIANGFPDRPNDDHAQGQNGFVTPATSRFPSQDISRAFQHDQASSHKIHNHSHSVNGHSHGHQAQQDYVSIKEAQRVLETPNLGTKIVSALISLLIALPFVLSSLVQVSPFELVESERAVEGDGMRLQPRTQVRYLSLSGVCALTAATLVTVGFIGELQGVNRSKSLVKSQKSTREQFLSLISFKKVIERILSIGLPFYAASKLGGERVAIFILVAFSAELATQVSNLGDNPAAGAWNILKAMKWTSGALGLQCIADLANLTTTSKPIQTISGYLALLISALIIPWPIPARGILSSPALASKRSRRNSDTNSLEAFGIPLSHSPLISSARDTEITVASGVLATIISFVVFIFSSSETQTLTLKLLIGGLIVAIASSVSLLLADSRALLSSHTSLPLILALGSSLFIQEVIDSHPLLPILIQSGLILLSWTGVCLDVKWLKSRNHSHELPPSWFSRTILYYVEDIPLLYRIFSKRDSRRIVYFMSMNFSFMFIQGIYGYLTGSLGLLSDTVHMFFDCAALGVGLVATLLSERQASLEYPYGFAKIDALAGFGNGVLLLAICFEFVYEAFERLSSGSPLNRLTELLVVSTGGLLVNVFGLLAFGHHGHSHGHDHEHEHGHTHPHEHTHEHLGSHEHLNGHDHKHDYEHDDDKHKHNEDCHHDHDHLSSQKENHAHSHSYTFDASCTNGGFLNSPTHPSPPPLITPKTPMVISQKAEVHVHSKHGHDHGHGHSHEGGSNMHGIYLHIMADMMGSVSVIVSTILVHYTGWTGWDALASVAISYFIIIATIPLVKSTAKKLVLDIPEDNEFDLREALSGVGQLRGVVNITAPRFWLESSQTSGVMHVVAGKGADLDDVRERAVNYLKSRNMDVLVQVEREGEGRCWCGSGSTNTTRAS